MAAHEPTLLEGTTRLLQRMERGEEGAADLLMEVLYRELHHIARHAMADEPGSHTLQPTALVNEAWLRLRGGEGNASWNDRQHFLRTAARAMRQVLVDHARARAALKRGGKARREPLDLWIDVLEEESVDMLALHEALEQLARLDPELVRLVELRFFAGLSARDAAQALDLSDSDFERGWRTARAWLRGRLGAR